MEFEQHKFNTYFNKTMRTTLFNTQQMETRYVINKRIEKSYKQLQSYIDLEYGATNDDNNQSINTANEIHDKTRSKKQG